MNMYENKCQCANCGKEVKHENQVEYRKAYFKTEDLINDSAMDKFLSAIPNQLGINLCSLDGIEFEAENDRFGQIKSMKLVFRPHEDKSDENYKVFSLNHGMSWIDWIEKLSSKLKNCD